MLAAALLAQAHRLARLAAARHEVEQYTAAYDEAAALEASGKPELAKLLRAEIEQTIGTALTTGPASEPTLSSDGTQRRPFALESPRPAEQSLPAAKQPTTPPEGQGTPPPARRRGRPKKKAAESTDPTTSSPITSPDHP